MDQKKGYKKTKIGWIPEDWELDIFENLFDDRKELNNNELPLLAVTNSDGIVLRNTLSKKDTSASDKSKYKTVYPNDIAYNTMRLWQGVSGLSNYKGIVSPAYTVLKPKEEVYSPFYQYLMKTEWMISWFLRFSSGICSDTNNCKYPAFKKIPALLPPLPEQKKIASILTTVDDKISSIENQIQQTEQLKKGLMEKLLTEGIGHTEFKDTVIGRIPEGWSIEKLKIICHKIFVGIATSTSEHYTDSGVPIIRNQNIKENSISTNDLLMITEEFNNKNHSKKLKEGDVITVRTGYPGISCVVPKEFENTQTFTTLVSRPKKGIINSDYLSRYINSEIGKKLVLSNQAGGAQQNLNVNRLKEIPIAIPSIREQENIVKITTIVEAKIEVITQKKYQYQTLKKGLSQQLLTGQMRVTV